MGFLKTIIGVKFVDHRHMLKLLARSITSQCSVIGCSILVLSWKIGYLWLKGPFKTMCKWNYTFSSIIHKHEILDTRERERARMNYMLPHGAIIYEKSINVNSYFFIDLFWRVRCKFYKFQTQFHTIWIWRLKLHPNYPILQAYFIVY